ncbi:MAG: energy transducer TonB [Bacteroidota bacterium]
MLLFIFTSILFHACKKDDSTAVNLCLAEIDGEFIEVELDVLPYYLNGGETAFYTAIMKVAKYPPEARELGYEGLSIVDFEISKKGEIENVGIVQDPGGGIGDATIEAVQVVGNGEVFSPGRYNKNPVRVKKQLELRFRLE